MESFEGRNDFEQNDGGIENPEQLCALIKNILHNAFEASCFKAGSGEMKMYEQEAEAMVELVKAYFQNHVSDYSPREREMFVQFTRLPVNAGSYFILRGIELLGALEYRLQPSTVDCIDHREFYQRMLPYLAELMDGFLAEKEPQFEKFVEIGEFTSGIIASDFYEMGKTYYEAQVMDLHEAFRDLLARIVEYKEDLRRRAVPVMAQHKYFVELVLNRLNSSEAHMN